MKKVINILLSAAILVIFTSCSNEADTVEQSQTNTGYVDTSPGTKNLEVKAIYPSDESTLVSRTAAIVVVFSKPVNPATINENVNVVLSGGITLNPPTPSADNTIFTFTHVGLANNTAYTVTIGTGITASDGGTLSTYVPPTAPAGHNFTTIDSDSEVINAIPVVLAATRYPTGTVSKATDYVELTFSEDMDPATIDLTTFTISAGVTAAAVTNVNGRTFRLELNNATVDYSEVITVTLLAGITSAAAVPLDYDGNHTWSFTVEADPDALAGVDAIGSVWFADLTFDSVRIYWTTNRAISGSTIDYGADSSLSEPPVAEGASDTVHYIDLSGLNNATRYYFQITTGTATSTLGYFMTNHTGGATNGTLLSDTPAEDVTMLHSVRNTTNVGVYDGSSYIGWKTGDDVRVKYIAADGTVSWAVDGAIVDLNHNWSGVKSFSDKRGGLIVTGIDGLSVIRTKRIFNNAGFTFDPAWENWTESASTQGVDSGTGTNQSAAIVWGSLANTNVRGGSITQLRNSTAVVLDTVANPNLFYDFDRDFATAVPLASVNNVLLNQSTQNLSLIANLTTYRHALNQDSANITSGINYTIGDHTVTTAFTALNHNMHVAGALNNGTNNVYTEHGYTLPLFVTVGDIVYDTSNTIGGRLTSYTLLNDVAGTDVGFANASYTDHLIDGDTDFTAIAGLNTTDCYARNVDPASPRRNYYSKITVIGPIVTELTLELLGSDPFPAGTEDYELIEITTLRAMGTATAGTSGASLEDTDNYFLDGGILIGDIVVNTTSGTMAIISTILDNTITLDASIFSVGDSYQIWKGTILKSGTANPLKTNHLIDGTIVDNVLYTPTGFNHALLAGVDYAVNTNTRLYGAVTAKSVVDLTLDNDIITALNKNYELLDLGGLLPQTGTNTSVSASELVDTAENFITVPVNSYVLNTADKTLTTVSAVIAHILALDDDIFVATDTYSLETGTGPLASGPVDTLIGDLLTDNTIGLDFTLLVPALDTGGGNAYARNTTTSRITQITNVIGPDTIQVLDPSIFTAGVSSYEVFNITGAATPGTADGTNLNQLIDSTTDFSAITAGNNSYAINTTNPLAITATRINTVIAQILTLNHHIFTAIGKSYDIRSGTSEFAGGSTARRVNYLIDAGLDFSAILPTVPAAGDYIREKTSYRYTTIQWPPEGTGNDQLHLDGDIFTIGNEGYDIIRKGATVFTGINTGAAANTVVDAGVYFDGFVTTGYIVINTSVTPNLVAWITGVTANTLTLDAPIFAAVFTPGQTYEIKSGSLLHSDTAGSIKPNHLIDGSKTTWGAALVGYLVQNTDNLDYAIVTAASPTDVTLDADIFTLGTENYLFYSDYCSTAAHYSAGDALDDFYLINTQVLEPIGASSGDLFTIYDSTFAGTAEAPPANPLFDNNLAIDFTAATAVAVNDFVFNTGTGEFTRVAAGTIYPRALPLASGTVFDVPGFFGYYILRFAPAVPDASILTTGRADGGIVFYELNVSTAIFGSVEKGDIVYNVVTQRFATVVRVNTTQQLTLNKDIFTVANEGFIVFETNERVTETGVNSNDTAVLSDANANFKCLLNPFPAASYNPVRVGDVVHNNSNGMETTVVSVDTDTQLTLQTDIFTATNQSYSVYQPRIIVAFQNANNIYAELLRLWDGSDCLTPMTIYDTASIAANPIAVSDNLGNAFVIYEISGVSIYGNKVDGAGNVGAVVPAFAAGTLIDVISDGFNGIYVLYENAGNVRLTRRDNAIASMWDIPVAATAPIETDSVIMLDSTGNPVVAYASLGNINISKFNLATGAAIYASQPVHTLGFFVENSDLRKSNISLTSDANNGMIISWIDSRYYYPLGYTIHSNAVNAAGSRSAAAWAVWDADGFNGTGTNDYEGIKIGILNSFDSSEPSFTVVNYDDGLPWNPRFFWVDYRVGTDSAIYYFDVNHD